MKSSYQSRALKMWKALAPYTKGCRTATQYYYAVEKFNKEHRNCNIKFAHGATRVCFICADYAIKKDYGRGKEDFGGCEDELRRYEDAQYEGYEYLFAPIEKIAHGVYVMPRVKMGKDYWSTKYLNRFFKNLTDDERDYISNVSDIHCHNVGLYHGRVVCIDYACE